MARPSLTAPGDPDGPGTCPTALGSGDRCRPVLWDGEGAALAPADPDALAAVHPTWAAVVAAGRPWQRVTGPAGAAWWEASGPVAAAPVVLCAACDSTQDAARWLVGRRLLGPGGSVIAAVQRAGRGTRGRPWAGAPGNLHATWVWPPGHRPAAPVPSLLAGLAVARALDRFGAPPAIKWPNDLLLGGRKVAGILVEAAPPWTITGVGLNLAWAPPDGGPELDGLLPATCLEAHGVRRGPLEAWLGILAEGADLAWLAPGRICAAVEPRLAWLGEPVSVREAGLTGEPRQAILLGLEPDGALRVRAGTRQLSLHGGRLSLAPPGRLAP